jgi:uncharacterized protein YecT (DUF1311 family)
MLRFGGCLAWVVLLVSLGPAVAVADEKCGGSTLEIVDCINADAQNWDKKLNAAYQAAMKRQSASQRERLRAAQRLWVQYRDANCRYYAMGEGSIARIEAANCVRAMTRQRTTELAEGAL